MERGTVVHFLKCLSSERLTLGPVLKKTLKATFMNEQLKKLLVSSLFVYMGRAARDLTLIKHVFLKAVVWCALVGVFLGFKMYLGISITAWLIVHFLSVSFSPTTLCDLG